MDFNKFTTESEIALQAVREVREKALAASDAANEVFFSSIPEKDLREFQSKFFAFLRGALAPNTQLAVDLRKKAGITISVEGDIISSAEMLKAFEKLGEAFPEQAKEKFLKYFLRSLSGTQYAFRVLADMIEEAENS